MITLARVVAKKLSSPKEKEQRVVLLGLDRGGKTRLFEWTQATLFHRPVRSDDDDDNGSGGGADGGAGTPPMGPRYTATLGASVGRGTYARHKLSVTDLGGLPKKRPAWADYYADTNALFWAVNIAEDAQRARLDESAALLAQVLASELLEACPVCVVVACAGANSDAQDAHIDQAQARFADLVAKERARRDIAVVFVDVADTSAHTAATRYTEVYDWLAGLLRAHGEHIARREKLIPELVQRALFM